MAALPSAPLSELELLSLLLPLQLYASALVRLADVSFVDLQKRKNDTPCMHVLYLTGMLSAYVHTYLTSFLLQPTNIRRTKRSAASFHAGLLRYFRIYRYWPNVRTSQAPPIRTSGHRKGPPPGVGMAYAERPGVGIDIF